MTGIRRAAAGTPMAAAILAAALALGAGGCSLLHVRPRGQRMATVVAGPCPPIAMAAILDRGPATLVWPEFRALVDGTARCGEHLFVIDAGSGRQLGSFTAPPAPTMRVPEPPPPLSAGATSFLTARHRQALAAYQALIGTDLARLHARERRQQAAWAATVMATVAQGNGAGLDPAGTGITRALDAALADFSSLEQSRVGLGHRKVVAVLGLAGLRHRAPALRASLAGASVVVTGFPPRPGLRRAWRSELRWEGAASVTLLTRATVGELAGDGARDLAEW